MQTTQYDTYLLEDFLKVKDWKEIFIDKYHMEIKEDDFFMLIDYNMILSPKCHLTNQCRGVIIDKESKAIVRRGFYRFFNYGEPEAVSLDPLSLSITEKVDGSFIGVFWNKYKNRWQVSTRGTIDANEAPLHCDLVVGLNTFYDLCTLAVQNSIDPSFWCNEYWNKDNTYIFELVSPYNRLVVPYTIAEVIYLTTIENKNNKEFKDTKFIEKYHTPKKYYMNTLEEVVACAKELPFSEEGYVVNDKFYNRLKVKSPQYLIAHTMKNNSMINKRKIVEMIRGGQAEEFVSYFPEYAESINEIKQNIEKVILKISEDWIRFNSFIFDNRKDRAKYITTTCFYPPCIFSLLDKKTSSIQQYLMDMNINNLLSLLERL